MSNNQFFSGVVRKKHKLFCVAPDGAQVDIMEIHDEQAGHIAKEACQKILDLMKESFEMDDGFHMKLETFMESANEIPLVEVKKDVRH